MSPLLQVDRLHITFGNGWSGRRVHAVDGVSLAVASGASVGLVGESGCGKSTLVAAALGLLPITRGQILHNGVLLTHRVGHARGPRPEDVQPIFQHVDAHLNPAWTTDALLQETAARFDRTEADIQSVLDDVGLSHRRHTRAGDLSGGERRRLGIGRVLLVRPRLILADEPCAGVDAGRRRSLVHALRRHQPEDSALLLVSHDLHLVRETCQQVHIMLGGRIVETVPTHLLGRVPHHPYTDTLLRAAGLRDGDVPDHHASPSKGCPLAACCDRALAMCKAEPQELQAIGSSAHQLACPQPIPSP